jgi:hypothetical protein
VAGVRTLVISHTRLVFKDFASSERTTKSDSVLEAFEEQDEVALKKTK